MQPTSFSFRASASLAVAAALEVLQADLSGPTHRLIVAIGVAAAAFGLAAGVAAAIWALGRPLAASPAARAAVATWPVLAAPAYMAYHDVKHDLLGPYPGRWVSAGARIGVALAALFAAYALARATAARPVRLAAVALLVLAPACAAWRMRPPAPGGPAVLLLTIDTLRADHLGSYGHAHAITPHLDRLSRTGVTFPRAFCQIPITTPSHASILTGLYPPAHAVRGQAYSMSRAVPTITEALRDAGFATAAFVAAFPLDSKFGLSRGFSVYDDEFSSRAPLSMLRLLDLLWPVPRIERTAAAVNARAARWLAAQGPGKTFLWAHYFEPHGPYAPAEPWRALYVERAAEDLPPEPVPDAVAAKALADVLERPPPTPDMKWARFGYLGEVAESDRAAGELLARARHARSGARDLSVVVLSDHGESLAEHGAYFRHGEDLYEPSLQVPLLRAGGRLSPAIDSRLVETVDVASMLADAAGVPWAAAPADRQATYAESTSAAVHYVPRKVVAARTSRHKLVRGAEDRRAELYDLDADPGEVRDVAATEAGAAAALSALLDGYLATGPTATSPGDVDRETIEKLKALGYLK